MLGVGEDIEAFAGAAKHGWPDRFAARVTDALSAEQLPVKDYLVRAKETTIALTATPLLALRQARKAWERRMGELLLGSPRYGRAKQPKDPDPRKAIPSGDIYLSLPGPGDRLAARIAGEIGDHIEQFDTPNGLQCYAGTAPVTRRSGRSELVAARRLGPQSLSRHRRTSTGLLQPDQIALDTPVPRHQNHSRQSTPQRAARPGQPMAGNPVAQPHPKHPLQRNHSHSQPTTGPPTTNSGPRPPEGVSSSLLACGGRFGI